MNSIVSPIFLNIWCIDQVFLIPPYYNTRPRDYYDVCILGTTQDIDKELFLKARSATAEHRGSSKQLSNPDTIIYNNGASTRRNIWALPINLADLINRGLKNRRSTIRHTTFARCRTASGPIRWKKRNCSCLSPACHMMIASIYPLMPRI